MEHRPCDRCGNQDAPFFDDEPNAPYCLDCLGEVMLQWFSTFRKERAMEQVEKRVSEAFDLWEITYTHWRDLSLEYVDYEEEDIAFHDMVLARQELMSAFAAIRAMMTPDEYAAYIAKPPSIWKRLFRR